MHRSRDKSLENVEGKAQKIFRGWLVIMGRVERETNGPLIIKPPCVRYRSSANFHRTAVTVTAHRSRYKVEAVQRCEENAPVASTARSDNTSQAQREFIIIILKTARIFVIKRRDSETII